MEKRVDVIVLYIQEKGRRLSFYVGENGVGYIPVFYTWDAARELADIMGKKFGLTLGFAVLQQVTLDSLEDNYVKAFPQALKYIFVYEGTSEFEAFDRKVR